MALIDDDKMVQQTSQVLKAGADSDVDLEVRIGKKLRLRVSIQICAAKAFYRTSKARSISSRINVVFRDKTFHRSPIFDWNAENHVGRSSIY